MVFTDKLPLELRRETYRHVLQREQAVKLTSNMTKASPEFDSSLFRVNKSISHESLAIFFESNVVHIQPHQTTQLINRHGSSLRRLHIEDDGCADNSALVSRIIESATTLMNYAHLTPRLKIVTFECHALQITVRELVERLAAVSKLRDESHIDPKDLRCVNVGTYILPIAGIAQQWRFSYTLLTTLWPLWQSRQQECQPSSLQIESYFRVQGPRQLPPWTSEAAGSSLRSAGHQFHNLQGLAHQISYYGTIEAVLPSLKSREYRMTVLRRFELMADWRIKKPVLQTCADFAGRIALRDVGSSKEHGSEVLEWATELLAPNTKDFAAAFGQSPDEARAFLGSV